jgi:hypothetical protein
MQAMEKAESKQIGDYCKGEIMRLLENMNQRIKKFDLVDEKLAQAAAIFFALIIVKLIPQIMNVSIWWFVVLLILCAIKPLYVFYIKK